MALALALAETGARLAQRRFEQGRLHVSLKADGTPVSDADMAVEHGIRARLELERPDDGVVGEEFGVSGNRRSRWLIDPVHGTDNLVRGDPRWAVMVALEVGGRIEAGVAPPHRLSAVAGGRRAVSGPSPTAGHCTAIGTAASPTPGSHPWAAANWSGCVWLIGSSVSWARSQW